MTHPDVAILIVTYNSSAAIIACLESTKQTGADVLVIDNASNDGTAALVTGLEFRIIVNRRNLGFAAAVNQGVCATHAPLLLLLNPDTVLMTGLEPLIKRCMSPETGAAGGRLVGRDGIPQRGFCIRRFPTPAALIFEALLINRLWPSNPVNWRYRCLGQDLDASVEVEQPAGAFLLFKRDAWRRVGGWDEGFFPIWFEDVDFCKRIQSAGFRIFYEPQSVAAHSGAHSISQLEDGTRMEYWYRSLLRYSIIHFRSGGRILTGLAVTIGVLLRSLGGELNRPIRNSIRSHGTVISLALRSMWSDKLKLGEPFL